ncbi:MAG: 3-deoxy-manno-octulosonate cytidylyltransferase [Candidatus Omnitrophica bacterium]|nr:3-deoxy-manno-octulosonate cytidylyltransferase [Candidatus Omnitrophota bacterium]
MTSVGVIPARYEASRFMGKVLADIGGKPMIQHVWERAKRARLLDDLIIAADDDRIIKAVEAFGGKVVFTAKAHPSGTDRLKEIVNPLDVDIVVNIQADEPLLRPSMIDTLVSALSEDEEIVMASLMKKITDPEAVKDPNVVKVVVDKNSFALYFSRSPIPFTRDAYAMAATYYKHIGLYAYTKDFLFSFTKIPVSSLEKREKLEQLRALENGYKIKMVDTKYDTIGVDTVGDLERVKRKLGIVERTIQEL